MVIVKIVRILNSNFKHRKICAQTISNQESHMTLKLQQCPFFGKSIMKFCCSFLRFPPDSKAFFFCFGIAAGVLQYLWFHFNVAGLRMNATARLIRNDKGEVSSLITNQTVLNN